MSRAKRPLNSDAVKKADDDFYANHPELIDENGNRIPLSGTDPAQADLRAEWMDLYEQNGGEVEGGDDDDKPPEKKPDDPVEPCPIEDDKPTIKVRWSKPKVTPDHNSGWPPASAPTDTIPEEAKVQPLVETTDVPDGTAATIQIRHCHTDALVKDGTLTELEVKGNKVVDKETGKPPDWVFDASHKPWDPWDKPYYYFHASVDYEGLEDETPKDYVAKESECLRVIYWHYCVAESGSLAGVLPECNQVQGILNGVAHSKAAVRNFGSPNISVAQYGSLLRNTYVFHQASHGNAYKRSDGSSIPANDPDAAGGYVKSQWRSTVVMTPNAPLPPRFGDQEINTAASVPSVPRYLFYSSTCLTGWEPSFANAMIGRGCRNVLAFRRTVPDAEAPQLAQKFYTEWAKHKLNPAKIPDCFFNTADDHYTNMKPILYGAGGGRIKSFWEEVGDAISDAVSGMAEALEDLWDSL